jgi:hypothetical protein
MISRFSKAWRSVLFSGQAWISKNPGRQKESSDTQHLGTSFFLYETLFKILMRLPYGQELWIGFFLSSFEDV